MLCEFHLNEKRRRGEDGREGKRECPGSSQDGVPGTISTAQTARKGQNVWTTVIKTPDVRKEQTAIPMG